jgi:hypothetical protein
MYNFYGTDFDATDAHLISKDVWYIKPIYFIGDRDVHDSGRVHILKMAQLGVQVYYSALHSLNW